MTAKVFVESAAALLPAVVRTRATGAPKLTPSATNCTVPVGDAVEPGEVSVTVAVKVTGWPKTDGLADEPMPMAVAAGFTVTFAEEANPVTTWGLVPTLTGVNQFPGVVGYLLSMPMRRGQPLP